MSSNAPSNAVERHEFGAVERYKNPETAVTAAAAQATALVQARFIMAMQRPRDLMVVREKMLADASRPGFAAVARYSIPRGGKSITGPSIRFAEAAARALGNLHIDQTVIYEDGEKRVCKVTVIDLESNISVDQSFVVEKLVERRQLRGSEQPVHVRVGSEGQKVFICAASEGDVFMKQQNLASKAIRNCVLRILPGDILEETLAQCDVTQRSEDAADPAAAAKKIADAFRALNVGAGALKEFLGHDIATASPAELAELRAVYSAVRDGEASWQEVIDARAAELAKRAAKTPGSTEDAERRKLVKLCAEASLADRDAYDVALGAAGIGAGTAPDALDLDALRQVSSLLKRAKKAGAK